MRRVLWVVRFLAMPLLLLAPVGCGKNYQLAPVLGRVTMDNRPLVGAEVSFCPANGSKDTPYAIGTTDDQGNYKLEVYVGGNAANGAVVGENRVTISLSQVGGSKKIAAKDMGKAMASGYEQVPAKYNRDSTLTFTVPPAGTTEANFQLSSR